MRRLHALIDAAFDARDVEVFLNRVKKAKLRIRDFEGDFESRAAGQGSERVLPGAAGFGPGADTRAIFEAGGSVPLELRQRYSKRTRITEKDDASQSGERMNSYELTRQEN